MECIPTGGLAVDEEEAAAKDDEAALPLTLPPLVASNEIAAPRRAAASSAEEGGACSLASIAMSMSWICAWNKKQASSPYFPRRRFYKGAPSVQVAQRSPSKRDERVHSNDRPVSFHFFYHAKRFPAGRHTLSHEKLAGR